MLKRRVAGEVVRAAVQRPSGAFRIGGGEGVDHLAGGETQPACSSIMPRPGSTSASRKAGPETARPRR